MDTDTTTVGRKMQMMIPPQTVSSNPAKKTIHLPAPSPGFLCLPLEFGTSSLHYAISMTRLVPPAKYHGLDEHAYFDQGGTTPFVRA